MGRKWHLEFPSGILVQKSKNIKNTIFGLSHDETLGNIYLVFTQKRRGYFMEFALCKRGRGIRIASVSHNCNMDTPYTKVKGVFDGAFAKPL